MWKSVSPLYRDRGCILRSGARRRRHVTALCLSVRRRAWDRKTENWTTKWNLNRESVKVQRCDWSRCYAQSGVGQIGGKWLWGFVQTVGSSGGCGCEFGFAAVLGLARFDGCGASSDGEKRVRGLKAGRQGDQACTPARGSVRQL